MKLLTPHSDVYYDIEKEHLKLYWDNDLIRLDKEDQKTLLKILSDILEV